MHYRREDLEPAARADEQYLTIEEVAARYKVKSGTIHRWRREGNFPKARQVGPGSVRWRLSDLLEHEGQLKACFAMHGPLPMDAEDE
ncbi:helix-turn-helix transcriptional regulator [Rhodobacter capsulatus]|uniref:helix-turn-helix transcriptional regulator n=1 Tax=Rhodobacter capsulatus TaxID=1061 RepID=UPI0009455F0E